jgi:hypothetical protein
MEVYSMDNMSVFAILEEVRGIQERMDAGLFLLVLIVSLLASLAASGLYRLFYESRATGSQVHRAFPLLGISITTVFIGVQISIPLSLGLLGALSIIRFRTPIKEPEEIGFIMLVIAASISAATLHFHFIVMLYAVALISLIIVRGVRAWKILRRDGVLVLAISEEGCESSSLKIEEVMRRHVKRSRLESTSSREEVTSLQYSFSGLKTNVLDLQRDLRADLNVRHINVFLDRPGGIR